MNGDYLCKNQKTTYRRARLKPSRVVGDKRVGGPMTAGCGACATLLLCAGLRTIARLHRSLRSWLRNSRQSWSRAVSSGGVDRLSGSPRRAEARRRDSTHERFMPGFGRPPQPSPSTCQAPGTAGAPYRTPPQPRILLGVPPLREPSSSGGKP